MSRALPDEHADPPAPARDVVWVAHRGGIVPGYPENTLKAFRHAIRSGAQVLEIDLRATKDGHLVVIHDRTLERTTNGRGLVCARTLAELKRLDAGGGERIPSYQEALELVAGTGVEVLLDIKRSRAQDLGKIVALTEQHGAVASVIAGVRSVRSLRKIRALNPGIRTLGFVRSPDRVDEFIAAGVDIVRLKYEWIERDPGLIERVHALGRPVWALAPGLARDGLDPLIDSGVDGIISDAPAMAYAVPRQAD